jgi:hypothetical protein
MGACGRVAHPDSGPARTASHRIEVQKDGYQPFTTTLQLRPGEMLPINVSLNKVR